VRNIRSVKKLRSEQKNTPRGWCRPLGVLTRASPLQENTTSIIIPPRSSVKEKSASGPYQIRLDLTRAFRVSPRALSVVRVSDSIRSRGRHRVLSHAPGAGPDLFLSVPAAFPLDAHRALALAAPRGLSRAQSAFRQRHLRHDDVRLLSGQGLSVIRAGLGRMRLAEAGSRRGTAPGVVQQQGRQGAEGPALRVSQGRTRLPGVPEGGGLPGLLLALLLAIPLACLDSSPTRTTNASAEALAPEPTNPNIRFGMPGPAGKDHE